MANLHLKYQLGEIIMDVIIRKENLLLNRIELEFRIQHNQQPTPSRKKMIELVVKAEPDAKAELTILKHVNTRFGQALTTGFAHIYLDKNSMNSTEMEYMLNRHAPKEESVVDEIPTKDDVSGGEE